MSLVIDTSIIIAVLTNEKSKKKIINITEGEELIAPYSLHWEIGNAFSAMMKRDRISIESAKDALKYYSIIPIKFVQTNLLASLRIANKFNIYAYDAYFLECASKLNVPLVTLDISLSNFAKQMNLKIIEV